MKSFLKKLLVILAITTLFGTAVAWASKGIQERIPSHNER